jgi:anti-anti-sigma factor
VAKSEAQERSAARGRYDVTERRICPPDELDPVTAEQFAITLTEYDPSGRLVIDFAGVAFCDSSGIRTLLNAQRRHHDAGGSVRLVNVRPPVRRVLEIARVDEMLLDPASRDANADEGGSQAPGSAAV